MRRQTPKNTAVQRDYYRIQHGSLQNQFSLEQHLAKIDSLLSRAINLLDAGKLSREVEQCEVAAFIGYQDVRTPAFFEEVAAYYAARQLGDEMDEGDPADEVRKLDSKQLLGLPVMSQIATVDLLTLPWWSWMFIEAPTGSTFITSDNPVVRSRASNFGATRGNQRTVLFPISARFCVLISEGPCVRQLCTTSLRHVRLLNREVARKAMRFIIGPDGSDVSIAADGSTA